MSSSVDAAAGPGADDPVAGHLDAGERLLASHRIHPVVLVLPAFIAAAGALQFTPWAFGPGSGLAGVVALAYGAFSGALFGALALRGRLAVTDRRVVYLQAFPFRRPDLQSWAPPAFDAVMLRPGAFGRLFGYGHVLLLRQGRLVSAVRAVRSPGELAARIQTDLLPR